jgi:hypothetical protein
MWSRVQCKIGKQRVAKIVLTRSAGSFRGPGADFWPHRISKGVPKSTIFEQIWKKWEKGGPRSGFKKTWFFYRFLMLKWDAWNLKKEVFALYMLQIMRFRQSGKLIETVMPKIIQNGSKIYLWAPRGPIFEILWRSGRKCFFDVFWDRKKSAQNPEKSDTLGQDGRQDC